MMDMVKMGNFLAELRKEHQLTQAELGERLGVTNKTVSRWETGTYMPPVEMLVELSELYGLSINELLCGRKTAPEEFKEVAEANIREVLSASTFDLKEKQEFWKNKWRRDHVFAYGCCLGGWVAGLLILKTLGAEPYMLGAVGGICSVVMYAFLNNRMMAYVEDRIYAGKWNKGKPEDTDKEQD